MHKSAVVNFSVLPNLTVQRMVLDGTGLGFRVARPATHFGVIGPDSGGALWNAARATCHTRARECVAHIRPTLGPDRERLNAYALFALSAPCADRAGFVPHRGCAPDALSNVPKAILHATLRPLAQVVAASTLRLMFAHSALAQITGDLANDACDLEALLALPGSFGGPRPRRWRRCRMRRVTFSICPCPSAATRTPSPWLSASCMNTCLRTHSVYGSSGGSPARSGTQLHIERWTSCSRACDGSLLTRPLRCPHVLPVCGQQMAGHTPNGL